MNRYKQQRMNMVACQLQPMGIKTPWILEAMGRVPRENFITDPMLSPLSYSDDNLYADQICVMLAPIITAQILQAADLEMGDDVLLKSNNPLYTHALIGDRCNVYTDEENLDQFDVIIYENSSLSCPPELLANKLKEGGRLLFILCNPVKCCKLTLVRRIGNNFSQMFIADVFLPMHNSLMINKTFEF